MNILFQRWRVTALGLLLLAGLCACVATGPGYDGATTSRTGTTTVGGGRVITWHLPAAASAARSSRRTTPIGRRPSPARLRRFQDVRVSEIHDRTNARNSIGRNAVIVIIVHLFSRC